MVYFGYDPDQSTWRLTIPNTDNGDQYSAVQPVEATIVEDPWTSAIPVLKQFASYLA